MKNYFLKSPFKNLHLHADNIHVWTFTLSSISNYIHEYLEECMSAEELHRANRFLLRSDRSRFLAGRGMLRVILSYYLSQTPDEIQLLNDEHGKPFLSGPISNIKFNAAHSFDAITFAFKEKLDVGIDIERIRAIDHYEKILLKFFSEREKTEFSTIPNEQKMEAFFTYWTRKEAYIKARGKGLKLPLDRFSVSFFSSEPVVIDDVPADLDAAVWSVINIKTTPGYIAAVSTKGVNQDIEYFNVGFDHYNITLMNS